MRRHYGEFPGVKMAVVKHNPNVSKLIDESIMEAPDNIQIIFKRIRQLILKVGSSIIEDWKWGQG